MFKVLLVASGGAVGAILRYSLTNFIKYYLYNNFYATIFINILGSCLIGYLISLGYAKFISENFIKYFLIIGFLGSFTTFSAFSYDALELFTSNKYLLSLLYITLSVLLCILAAFAGMYINKVWLKY